ncbi:LLM class flavin-dependent oxidoreductase [Streptomyces halstedii]
MTSQFRPTEPVRLYNLLLPSPDVSQVGTWPPEGDMPTLYHQQRTIEEAEAAGFHGMLAPTAYSNFVDNWVQITMLLARTHRIEMLGAIRPNQVHPAQFAKQCASILQLVGCRLSLNVVLGGWDVDDRIIGAVETAEQRLARAEEWLTILCETWESSGIAQDYSHKGDFYDIEGLRIYPALERRPEIFLSGMSDEAIRLSGMFADTHVLWAERPEDTRRTIERVWGGSAAHGRRVRIALRMHVIVRETEEEAWRAAEHIAARIDPQVAETRAAQIRSQGSNSRRGQLTLAQDETRIGRHLWTGTGTARFGASVSVVGDAEQVTEQLMEFRRMGVDDLILSGYPKEREARRFGQLVTQRLMDADLEFRRQHRLPGRSRQDR